MFYGSEEPVTTIINGDIVKFHHRAAAAGYISRRTEKVVSKYSGRYGEGYTVDYPRRDTSRYIWRVYWIKVKY